MKQEFIENIEAYLDSEITYDALKAIADLDGITELDDKIEWVQNTILAVDADGLKAQLQDILPQSVKKEAKVVNLSAFKFIAGIAASILLVVFAYWGLQNNEVEQNNYALYEYNDPGLPVTMSQSDDYALYDALTYFGEENYSKCIQKLNAIAGEKSDTVSYYLGACHYYEANYTQAINQLKTSTISEGQFNQQAEWLLMMSYLKSDQIQDARELLQQISANAQHQFYDKGRALLKKIESQ